VAELGQPFEEGGGGSEMEKQTLVGVAWWMWYEEVHLLNHRIIEKCFFIRLQGD
jgi:hypothetical protein